MKATTKLYLIVSIILLTITAVNADTVENNYQNTNLSNQQIIEASDFLINSIGWTWEISSISSDSSVQTELSESGIVSLTELFKEDSKVYLNDNDEITVESNNISDEDIFKVITDSYDESVTK